MSAYLLTGEELAAAKAKLEQLSARTAGQFAGRLVLDAEPAYGGGTSLGGHCWKVKLKGAFPLLNGWKIIARADLGTVPPSVWWLPGAVEVPVADWSVCEHCHTRRNRNETVLLSHVDSGQMKIVGSTCLKDFTGRRLNPLLLDLGRAERMVGLYGKKRWTSDSLELPLRLVIACAWQVTQVFGFVPARSKRPRSTVTLVKTMLGFHGQEPAAELAELLAPFAPAAPAAADRIIAKLKRDYPVEPDDAYAARLLRLVHSGWVAEEDLPTAVSAVRALRNAERDLGGFVGTVGQRVNAEGTVVVKKWLPKQTSPSQRYLLVVSCGNRDFKTVSGAEWLLGVNPGDQVRISGTVAKHETYRQHRQTVLARVELLSHSPARRSWGKPAMAGV
ncbi:MAG: hypothetical protein LBR20_06445 [Propionibacteriaceae bacterium]|nr:hypothetical protein [Propionibacteriaceae bacterium]